MIVGVPKEIIDGENFEAKMLFTEMRLNGKHWETTRNPGFPVSCRQGFGEAARS